MLLLLMLIAAGVCFIVGIALPSVRPTMFYWAAGLAIVAILLMIFVPSLRAPFF